MTQHTPGPWRVEDGYRGPIGGPQETYYITIVTDTPASQIVIADLPTCRGNDGAANARLIAAVPELLEIMECLLGYAESRVEDEGARPLTHMADGRALLARIRGE